MTVQCTIRSCSQLLRSETCDSDLYIQVLDGHGNEIAHTGCFQFVGEAAAELNVAFDLAPHQTVRLHAWRMFGNDAEFIGEATIPSTTSAGSISFPFCPRDNEANPRLRENIGNLGEVTVDMAVGDAPDKKVSDRGKSPSPTPSSPFLASPPSVLAQSLVTSHGVKKPKMNKMELEEKAMRKLLLQQEEEFWVKVLKQARQSQETIKWQDLRVRVEAENARVLQESLQRRKVAMQKKIMGEERQDREVVVEVERRMHNELISAFHFEKRKIRTYRRLQQKKRLAKLAKEDPAMVSQHKEEVLGEALQEAVAAYTQQMEQSPQSTVVKRIKQLRRHQGVAPHDDTAPRLRPMLQDSMLQSLSMSRSLTELRTPSKNSQPPIFALLLLQEVGKGYLRRVKMCSLLRRRHTREALPQIHGDDSGETRSSLLSKLVRMRHEVLPGWVENDDMRIPTLHEDHLDQEHRKNEQDFGEMKKALSTRSFGSPKRHNDMRHILAEARTKRMEEIEAVTRQKSHEIRMQELRQLALIKDTERNIQREEQRLRMLREKRRAAANVAERAIEKERERQTFVKEEKREIERIGLHMHLRQLFMRESNIKALNQTLLECPGAKQVAGLTMTFSFRKVANNTM